MHFISNNDKIILLTYIFEKLETKNEKEKKIMGLFGNALISCFYFLFFIFEKYIVW